MRIVLGGLELRRFGATDTADLYRIRNDDSVRAFMADARPLDFDAHVRWVSANLVDDGALLLLMARMRGEAIGFSLLKRLADDRAEIGVMFRDAPRHQVAPYHTAVVTLHVAFEVRGLRRVESWVLPSHERALSLNRSLGAGEAASDKPGMLHFFLDRETCLANANYRKVMARIGPRIAITPG
jgi:RimJ/RimL family protein N-acetyltransferase